jgi:hypothetical protein
MIQQERSLKTLFSSEEFAIGFGFGAITMLIILAIVVLGW